jgi:hypothetical protein
MLYHVAARAHGLRAHTTGQLKFPDICLPFRHSPSNLSFEKQNKVAGSEENGQSKE